MSRRTPTPVSPTGMLDAQAPIRPKCDGREVNAWFDSIRDGNMPSVDLFDQLSAAGWQHITISKVEEIIDERKRLPIGFSAIFNCLSKAGCELEIEITDTKGRKHQVALCRNEFTLLHGHTTNRRGPERRVRLKMATTPGTLGGMLLATR